MAAPRSLSWSASWPTSSDEREAHMSHTSTCQIRPFTPTDQQAARRLILEGLGEHFGFIDETRNPDLDDIWTSYVAAEQLFVVVHSADELVGTGALCVEDDAADQRIGRIKRVSVESRYRQQGIGRAIVMHLIEAARQRGWTRLLVETNHDWFDAIGLYQRCGFVPYDRDEESVHLALELR